MFRLLVSGHGLGFILEPEVYDSLDSAAGAADWWVGHACTIGGDARVIDDQDRVHWPERLKGQPAPPYLNHSIKEAPCADT
jgi:hypothetical protein